MTTEQARLVLNLIFGYFIIFMMIYWEIKDTKAKTKAGRIKKIKELRAWLKEQKLEEAKN